MYFIEKEFHFSASHQLNGLPEDHQCARLHGHNYILKVGLFAESLNEVGFVLDYGELGFVKDYVDAMDHRHLNDLFEFNPTSELICTHFVREIAVRLAEREDCNHIEDVKVSLSETPKTWAHYDYWMDELRG